MPDGDSGATKAIVARRGSRLLIDEHPLQVLPSLAVAVGLEKAIILQQLHYWTEATEPGGGKRGKLRDGYLWTYNPAARWQQQFPFMSVRSVQRHFAEMERSDPPLIFSTDAYNADRGNRTKWSRVNYDALAAIAAQPSSEAGDDSGASTSPEWRVETPNLSPQDDEHGASTSPNWQAPELANLASSKTETNAETSTETKQTETPTVIGLPADGGEDDDCTESASDDEAGEDGDPIEPGPNTLLGRFNRWYAVYPRKVQKQSAIKAWKQIKPDAALTERMIEAVEAQKAGASWLKENGQFIPYPASWLRAGSWEDEIEAVAPAAPPPPTGTGFRGMKYGFTPFPLLAESSYPLTPDQLGKIEAGAKLKDALTEQQFEHVSRAYAIHCRRFEYRVGEY